ncbi:FecR family protein [Sunxiuqinia sp. A32]|uniref:FecR family protein n=1 Tax=Sunxiuqinia sp. A32 TaxID=3461496 RepID=UPI0040456BC9
MENKIHQYLEGKLSEKNQKQLLDWIKEDDNQRIFESIKQNWWKSRKTDSGVKDFGQVRLNDRLKEKRELEKSTKMMRLYKYAAIALLVIGLSGTSIIYFTVSNQVLQFTEVQTDLGQVSSMTLPDGSTIWLNSGTKLSYNNQYGISNRNISVDGEAFFSVTKNKEIPFVVKAGLLKVEVTGTQFGVSNYSDSKSLEVVLKEGSVNVNTANGRLLTSLQPNEMARFNKSEPTIEKLRVNPEHYISWKDGIIHFFELPLSQLVKRLEKRYNQKFEVDPAIQDLPFTFSVEDESLSDVIYLLGRISPIKAEQDGNIIKLRYEPKK